MRAPRKLLTIAIPLAVLCALLVAGCGGGGSDSTASTQATATTPTLTKAELIAEGDSICAEVNAAVGSVGETEAGVSSQITQVSDLYVGMVTKLKALGTPTETAGYDELIAAADELSTIEGETKLATEREDTEALGEAATKAAPALEEFESVAGEYGFEQCSEGPRAPTPGAGAGAEAEAGGTEVAPEASEEAEVEEVAPEEVTPETGGAGGGVAEEAAPEGGGTGGTSGGGSGGIGPG